MDDAPVRVRRHLGMTGVRQQLGPLLIAALLGAAGTAACLQPPPVSGSASPGQPAIAVPALPHLPRTFAPPASVHGDATTSAAVDQGTITTTVSDTGELPPARALEAYRRATTVMAEADPSCRLSWPLLAAIGSIESDHGRIDGSALGADGVADPPILGPPLDGAGPTARILDTDHGSVDGDVTVDRAVGPLQLIPSTWAAVAVDGDSDGVRDPQDIDDASLAAAVYLCAWHDDLATDAGRRSAVFRYNRSWSYVDRVLQTMQQYATALADDLVAVLMPTTSAVPAGTDIITAEEPVGPGLDAVWTVQGGAVWFVSPITQWVVGPSPGTTEPATMPAPTPDPVLAAPALSAPTLTPMSTPTETPTLAPTETPTESPTGTPTPPTSAALPTTPVAGDEPTGSPGAADPTPSSAPVDPGPTERTSPSPDADPTSDGAPPPASAPPESSAEIPAGLSAAEVEAWLACVVISDDASTQASCLASALGLPLDDPRVVWLLLQVPGREAQ